MTTTALSGSSSAPSGSTTAASRCKIAPSGSTTAPSRRTIDPSGSRANPLSKTEASNDASNDASGMSASFPPPQASRTPKAGAITRATATAKKRCTVFMISHGMDSLTATRVSRN
jgi:hypothetical protein